MARAKLAAATSSGSSEAAVYRLGAAPDRHNVVDSAIDAQILFDSDLTRDVLATRHRQGSHVVAEPAGTATSAGHDVLFLVHPDGRLDPVTRAGRPPSEDGDIAVVMVSSTPTDAAARR